MFELEKLTSLIPSPPKRWMLWQVGGPLVNDWRRRLGFISWSSQSAMLPSVQRINILCLYGDSASIFPKPDDWDDMHHITGYWFLNSPSD